MKKIILILIAFIILVQVSNSYKEDYYIIPNKSIRIRIIPNSNSLKDQYLKGKVKINLEKKLKEDLENVKTIEETREIIINNLEKYEQNIKETINDTKIKQKSKIDYGYHTFPEKIFKGVKYKEGKYESLLITLGKGEGDNWWCILFPPLCQLEGEDTDNSKIEYSLYIKEMFDKYIK